MKKALAPFAATAALFAFSACSSAGSSFSNDSGGAPEWAARGSFASGGILYAAGFARGQDGEKAQKKAEANARNQIAMRIEADAESALVLYVQDAGIGDESDLEDSIAEIARETAERAFSKSFVEEAHIDEGRGAYVLVGYDLQSLALDLQMRVNSSVQSESSSLAEFRADDALRLVFGWD